MREISIEDIEDTNIEVIGLGVKGENNATSIAINISSWVTSFGEGTPILVAKRPDDDTTYSPTITLASNIITWNVLSTDVSQPGIGKLQIKYSISGTIVKSKIFTTVIADSLDDPE